MTDPYKSALLFGAPGVGKGTQGELIGKVPGFYHMSTGDMFRSMSPDSEMGRVFAEYSKAGKLVPDEVVVSCWSGHVAGLVERSEFDPTRQLLVLDGMPRTPAQAEALRAHIDVLAIVHLVAPDKELMVQRLLKRAKEQGRHDDASEGVVRNRLQVYLDETKPVLGCYEDTLVHEVDGMGTPGWVLSRSLAVLAEIQEKALGNPLR